MSKKTRCSKCESYDSMYWEKDDEDNILCDNCNEDLIARNLAKEIMQHEIKLTQSEEEMSAHSSDNESDSDDDDIPGPAVRRSTRNTMNRYKNPEPEPSIPVHRNRRALAFSKRNVYKSPTATATCVTSDYVFHRGAYYQLGDIVAIVDSEGRGVFYAQITGFLTDQYCNKSATIQWLLPTKESPPHNIAFDARTYYLGYIEDQPRSLDSMIPIMHAPSDYYKFNNDPYPPPTPRPGIARYVLESLERIYIKRAD